MRKTMKTTMPLILALVAGRTLLAQEIGFAERAEVQDIHSLDVAGVLMAQNSTGASPFQVRVEGGPFQFISGELVGGKTVTGSPYSAQVVNETVQTLADGNRIVQRSSTMLYRDSQGRERREESLGKIFSQIGAEGAQNQTAQTILISDPVAGFSYTLLPNDHAVVKQSMPTWKSGESGNAYFFSNGSSGNSGMAWTTSGSSTFTQVTPLDATKLDAMKLEGMKRDIQTFTTRAATPVPGGASSVMMYTNSIAPGAAPAVEQLGVSIIEGVSALGTRSTVTIPAGQIGNDKPIQIVDEQWYSDDLHATVLSKHSDPRMGETTYSLKNISRSEPDPSLFQVPAGYTIRDTGAAYVRKPAKQ